jgi:DNA-binding transcriptional LysR family regulator
MAPHRCIHARLSTGAIWHWEFECHGESTAIDVSGALALDDKDLMEDAALAGVGLAYLTEFYVAGHIASGRLVTVLEEWMQPYSGICLYFPNHRHVPTDCGR